MTTTPTYSGAIRMRAQRAEQIGWAYLAGLRADGDRLALNACPFAEHDGGPFTGGHHRA